MLGWMLKRGETAPVDDDGADTTTVDQPDTPAPVFAARAFKSALFGAPNPQHSEARNRQEEQASAATVTPTTDSTEIATPSKPQGILLTPGTGTSRRKRVSFGHDVASRTNHQYDSAPAEHKNETRKRTLLTEALDNSRKKNTLDKNQDEGDTSDEWEEADDADHCTHDITLDLNEPHSQSGRYWKDECHKYRAEAKVEMDKLLRYKQMAKSFARQRDSEAVELAEKLRDEQQKVLKMERKIAENASRIASSRNDALPDSDALLLKLTKQTALAVQYRQRVQDLESQLNEREPFDDGLAQSRRRRQVASPRTQKTLIETQRELRRARAQVKELGELREQVASLKTQLKAADRASGNQGEIQGESARAQDLRSQLRLVKEESRKKDEEIRRLKGEFETFRKESDAHQQDTKAVLERAHTKISDLKKEIKTLRAAGPEVHQPRSLISSNPHDPLQTNASRTNIRKAHEASQLARTGVGRPDNDSAHSEEDGSLDLGPRLNEQRTLRQQFRDEAEAAAVSTSASGQVASNALVGGPTLEKPRWQPFVARSPRNRDYLGKDLARRIQNGGATPAAKASGSVLAPDLPALAKSICLADQSDIRVDLLQDRFAQLGGPDLNRPDKGGLSANTSSTSLPPERRAAALARIEQSMAKKRQARRRDGHDKENVQPIV